ncbi:MAG: tetratricopeptide repeat protein [Spirochaetes bacterium]|nr:tetratricopeptide repeat protein [Spirochaetota bacterium]
MLRQGNFKEARCLFDDYLAVNPNDSDALVGNGFATLRDGDIAASKRYFQKATQLFPDYSDAHYGLALVLERLGDREGAMAAIAKAVKLAPDRADFTEAATRLLPAATKELSVIVRPATLQMGFRIGPDKTFQVFEKGEWRSFFWKGVNIGAALPGKFPSEFPSRKVYDTWLTDIGEMGFDVLRVYTIHPPAFYDALRDYNLKHEKPLYLVHGVWAELPPNDDFLDAEWLGDWKEEMRRVIDLLHGHAKIPARPGHSSGSYQSDVSSWTAGIILGREWEAPSVREFNKLHPESTGYMGKFVTCPSGTPMEILLARGADYFMSYESDTYNAQRPVAFTNWPTLDPLYHVSESGKVEEGAWKKKLGMMDPDAVIDPLLAYDEDSESIDMEKLGLGQANKAGLFASYHAYPYYPDFLDNDPALKKGVDAQGPNNYKAYLDLLVAHHAKYPVVISEFGIPSSRISAHWQPQGITHGRHTEKEQGELDARLLSNIYDSGCAGAVLFEWMDEWFKKNWLVYNFERPIDRKPLWYNFLDAEENYGLIGSYPGKNGPSILIDGNAGDWANVPVYAAEGNLTVKALADEGWLHLGIFWPKDDTAAKGYMVGINIDDPSKGNQKLPFGLGTTSQTGLEFAAIFQGAQAALFVDQRYDLFAFQEHGLFRLDGGANPEFIIPQAETNPLRIGRDGTVYQARMEVIGWLRRGTQDRTSSSFDSLAEWNSGPGFLEARIPWGMLNIGDPSSSTIVQPTEGGIRSPKALGKTDGMRFVLASYSGDAFSSHASFLRSVPGLSKGRIPLPPLFTWSTWEEPTWHQVRKQSYLIYKDALSRTPGFPKTK